MTELEEALVYYDGNNEMPYCDLVNWAIKKQQAMKPLAENKYYGVGKCPKCKAIFLNKTTNLCGCGINVAPLAWVKKECPNAEIYKLLIKWEWLPGVVVPYDTDGKIRCERAMILGKVDDDA